MACGCCLFGKLFQLTIIYGYPGYKVMKSEKPEKIWIIYFLIIGVLSVLEGTLFFPIFFILDKICKRIVPTLKILFHLWLYYPEYRGALLLDQNFGEYINKAFLKLNPTIGKFLTILGLPNRDVAGVEKKNE